MGHLLLSIFYTYRFIPVPHQQHLHWRVSFTYNFACIGPSYGGITNNLSGVWGNVSPYALYFLNIFDIFLYLNSL